VNVDAETARAVGVLEKARAMSRQDLARQRLELAVELCPRRMTPRPLNYGDKYHGGEPCPSWSRARGCCSRRLRWTC